MASGRYQRYALCKFSKKKWSNSFTNKTLFFDKDFDRKCFWLWHWTQDSNGKFSTQIFSPKKLLSDDSFYRIFSKCQCLTVTFDTVLMLIVVVVVNVTFARKTGSNAIRITSLKLDLALKVLNLLFYNIDTLLILIRETLFGYIFNVIKNMLFFVKERNSSVFLSLKSLHSMWFVNNTFISAKMNWFKRHFVQWCKSVRRIFIQFRWVKSERCSLYFQKIFFLNSITKKRIEWNTETL